MSMSEIALDNAELAKNYITNSTLPDEYKKVYLRLINLSTKATNGYSPEEKLQRMSECIQLLAITQGMYLSKIDDKIESAINRVASSKCTDCKAMDHALKIEEEEQKNELLESYMKKYGIKNANHASFSIQNNQEELTWIDVLKTILTKPYIYAVASLLLISPYSVDIVTVICQFLAK